MKEKKKQEAQNPRRLLSMQTIQTAAMSTATINWILSGTNARCCTF